MDSSLDLRKCSITRREKNRQMMKSNSKHLALNLIYYWVILSSSASISHFLTVMLTTRISSLPKMNTLQSRRRLPCSALIANGSPVKTVNWPLKLPVSRSSKSRQHQRSTPVKKLIFFLFLLNFRIQWIGSCRYCGRAAPDSLPHFC